MNLPYRGIATLPLLLATLGLQAAPSVQLNIDPGQGVLVAGESHKTFIRIGLEGVAPATDRMRSPINVALVLDRSGSMRGDKIHHAREAARRALDYLRPNDIVSLVTYDHTVQVPVPATRVGDGSAIKRAIDAIRPGGNTALFAGVSKGAAEVRKYFDANRVNRVILLSDGLANVGPSSPGELQRLGRKLGGQVLSVTTIGLGLGYNEDLMVRLAEASDGNHLFAESPEELAGIFRNEFGELGTVVAQGVRLTIICPDGVKPLRVLGREAEIRGDRVTSRLNQLYADQEKYLILEVEVPGTLGDGEQTLARVEVEFDDIGTRQRQQTGGDARVRFSGSAEEASASVKREVMISATEQIAVELDDEALERKDSGDTEGARALFKKKADYLDRQATAYDSDKLRSQGDFSRQMEEAVAAPAPEWNKARKEVREEQFIIRKQQSYK